jgi:hypothetical protein
MAVTISSVKARQIFDSRGNPTVEVQFYLAASFLDSVCLACFDLLHVFFWTWIELCPVWRCCAGGYQPQRRELREGSRAERRVHRYVSRFRETRCSVLCFRSVVIRFSAKLWVLLIWALSPCREISEPQNSWPCYWARALTRLIASVLRACG